MFHLGVGDGAMLVEKPTENHQKELGESVFAPDSGRSGDKSNYF
jgi:hypothetical protein